MKEDVFDYLNGILGECWSRHAFDKTCKSDHVTNYFTESFNSWLNESYYGCAAWVVLGLPCSHIIYWLEHLGDNLQPLTTGRRMRKPKG
ncbi:hypothetical protein Patl1_32593 [Pistacia atlantica]|uniref:Uncharacterized protein n=1 Tax=Pistacia atlantica TaxID=434234 RepID=A0ACC1API2_9ROSI|nr:hypothetical protein Patl1_32593 [Pistacia atlantica]